MLRSAASKLTNVVRGQIRAGGNQWMAVGMVRNSSHSTETDEQFDNRYEAYFNRPDIDGWQVRKGMNDLLGMDLVPEPKIISAALKACRRLNDFALAIRWLEGVKEKCGPKLPEIYPYLLSEIRPTLDQLGINTPEELGFDKPEMGLKNVDEL